MIRTILLLPLLALCSAPSDARAPAGTAEVKPPVVQLSAESPAAALPRPAGRVADRAGLLDARAQEIMDGKIVPACREGRCDRAIADGVAAISELLRSDTRRPRRKGGTA